MVFDLLYDQAVSDIGKGQIPCEDKLTQLRSLKSEGKKEEVCVCVCVCVCNGGTVDTRPPEASQNWGG